MTVQRLSNYLDRVASKGALQHREHAVAFFAQRVQTGADDAEVLGTGERAETSHIFCLTLGTRTARSPTLLVNGTAGSPMKRRTASAQGAGSERRARGQCLQTDMD